MKLEFESGRSFESPTPNQMANGFAGVGDGSFAILSNGDDFIQAAGKAGSGFVVEYREGDKLYQCSSQSEPPSSSRSTVPVLNSHSAATAASRASMPRVSLAFA